ncbi:RHS repeat protein, partial [Escherichia coli]|nr:RHS repeat protein [Escherichia coli]
LATNSAQEPWWILGWSERVPGAEDVLPAPLPPYRELTGLADRFGRTLTYRREAAGDLTGEITGVTDGAGREFRLVLTTQAQRAEEARTSSLSSSDSSRPLSASAFPDTLPGTEYGPDRGIRLSAVWLMHDPAYPESLPAAPLVRYTYTEAGELLAVYDRSNTQVRAFTYDAQHPGRMVAHRYAGRPEMRYRYDDAGRVVEQLNPAGLSYRYQYEQDRITVTDSLNRREVLHTEGGAGLKRVVKKELADGSVTHSGYDAAGRLTAQTDAAGRRTEYGEREKAQRRSLAETLQQEGSENGHGVVFPAELVRLLDRLEGEIRANCVSSESRQWLAQCGLTVERLAAQIEPVYLPERKIHLYHCDHRGLPLALISEDGNTAWSAEYDEWGNQLNEENPHHLHQPYRLPGQQYDKESGLYYNRNRYYDPLQGRYITQDPIGLEGGWSLYAYPLNPVNGIDPLGLSPADVALIRRKDQLNHQRAWDILSDTYEDMKRLNLGGTDQFFHCMAFCRVSKLNDAGVSRSAKGLGYEKEIRDYGLNLFGMYGRKVKLSHSEMIEDNKKDLAVNDHGLTCPSTTDCSDRCSDYINPEHKKTIKTLQDAGYLK